jgi:hypothetical protein
MERLKIEQPRHRYERIAAARAFQFFRRGVLSMRFQHLDGCVTTGCAIARDHVIIEIGI